MNLTLFIGNSYSWKFTTSEVQSAVGKENVTIKLEVIPLSNLFEHEEVLDNIINADQKGYPSLTTLKQDIIKRGFLHPVLAQYLQQSRKWVLADGTHRLKAMQSLDSKFIVGMKLKKENYRRDCWVKTLPNCPKFNYFLPLEILKRNYPKTIIINTVSPEERATFLAQNCKHDLLAYINSSNQAYEVINRCPEDRFTHLKIIKEIDALFESSEKDYKTRDELTIDHDSFILLPPPIDEEHDMSYLVDHEKLRRMKGSRTVLAVRPVYFSIPFDMLQQSENEIYNYLAEGINESLANSSLGTIYTNKSSITSLDPSWYSHTLLVGNKRFLLLEASNEIEKNNLENLFIPLIEQ